MACGDRGVQPVTADTHEALSEAPLGPPISIVQPFATADTHEALAKGCTIEIRPQGAEL